MRRSCTTARGLFTPLLAAVLLAGVVVIPAPGAPPPKAKPILFPLVAKVQYWDNYGDPRGNGRHAGIDIEAPKRAPVVAVEAGRIRHWSSGLGGCMLYLHGQSGTTYFFIHLNNDLTLGNDNRGRCVKGVSFTVGDGARVLAGQQIGINGDSGDANGNPHLHFEVHPGDGPDVNPFPYLQAATQLLFTARQGTKFALGLRGRALAAGAGRLRVEVTRVRTWPNGGWLEIGARAVDVEVPLEAAMEKRFVDAVEAGLLTPLPARPAVTVYTVLASVTMAALQGKPGALTASRISSAP
jgi:hypothetical protein